MKKWVILVVVLFAVFVVLHRQRLFLRDPLGSVVRDGVKDDGAQVFINYSNEVLIENDHPPMYVTVVQAGDHVGLPAVLRCLHWTACLTDADSASLIAPMKGARVVEMTNRRVEFKDDKGRDVVVTIR